MCSCGSVVEHCVSNAKGCGFNSHGTHILTKKCTVALDKSIHVNVNIFHQVTESLVMNDEDRDTRRRTMQVNNWR